MNNQQEIIDTQKILEEDDEIRQLYFGQTQLTDLTNAELFVRIWGDRVRHCLLWGKWLWWDGSRWRIDERNQINFYGKSTIRNIYLIAGYEMDLARREELAHWAIQCESANRIFAMLKLVQSERLIAKHPDNFDQYKSILNVKNGMIDLSTGEFLEHNKLYHITKLAPVNYDPDAKAPLWDQFLARIMNGNVAPITFLKKAVGLYFQYVLNI